MNCFTQTLFLGCLAIAVTTPAALADTYSCQYSHGVRFASQSPCPNGSREINVIRTPKAMSVDYVSDARQQEEANQQRGNTPPASKMEPRPQYQTYQPWQQSPAVRPFNKAQWCENNWEEIRHLDAAARVNSTEDLKIRRQQLMDERWKINC